MIPFSCIVYYSSLLACVSLGGFYKSLATANMKRDFGTGVGLLLTVLICRQYVYHSLLMVWVNIIIIKCCNRSYMHQISLAYTWTYLLYLHLNVKNIYVIWLHQMQALKLVGLAFEINSNTIDNVKVVKVSVAESSSATVQPTSAEIAAYSYSFIGLHKGPYFRWKHYSDHLNDQYIARADLWPVTELQLKKGLVCTVAYLLLRAVYSPELYISPSFYQDYGADFRFLYNIPLSVMHLLRYEAAIMVSMSVCTETGLGVYSSKNSAIHTGFLERIFIYILNLFAKNDSSETEEKFDFSSIKCFSNKKLLFGPTMKDTISSLDIPTRTWFWSNIYHKLLKSNKESRSIVSFIAWAIWRGPSVPTAILASTLWVYIQLESGYRRLYNTTGSMKLPWDIGLSIMRLFCLLYLTPCFVLNDTVAVFTYYNSIFWVYHIILFVLMIIAVLANKFEKS